MEFRGEIYNEDGKCIFSRKARADNEEKALQMLHEKVCIDVPDERQLIEDMSFIRGVTPNYSQYGLKHYYKDITKLTFKITKQ